MCQSTHGSLVGGLWKADKLFPPSVILPIWSHDVFSMDWNRNQYPLSVRRFFIHCYCFIWHFLTACTIPKWWNQSTWMKVFFWIFTPVVFQLWNVEMWKGSPIKEWLCAVLLLILLLIKRWMVDYAPHRGKGVFFKVVDFCDHTPKVNVAWWRPISVNIISQNWLEGISSTKQTSTWSQVWTDQILVHMG